MAKKDKKGENSVQNKEIFQRMNFLYQAAMCMATITTPPPGNNSKSSLPGDATESQAATDSTIADTATSHDSFGDPISVSAIPTTSASVVDMNNLLQGPRKLSRKKTRKLLRERKNRIAMEQISDRGSHHRLTNPGKGPDPRPLSGTARFYASTLMEVGRKNVIRIRYFCMPGKGIEGDRWEVEETIGREGNDTETGSVSATTSSATTPAETHDVGSDNVGLEDSVMERAEGMEGLILQEDVA
ncbi:hypothetical protein KI688_000117 [Linnemannia hyalina]|uniref:Uncharacterized protein n=1 Tax=Linnemannia hyalina TaxID=64524 RepID=A0A9P7Y404_9FUNG|nr:hypothetical protein KI688_000117 [Linnemannia hyalina]